MKIKNVMNYKIFLICILSLSILSSCNKKIDKESVKKEIAETEKAFEKMASEKGIAEAFYHFADENAAIKRNNGIIAGKQNIKDFYNKENLINATVNWSPDFIEVSDDGTLGYTYGKYLWRIEDEDGKIQELKGVFNTVWKRQKDNNWKYVWD